MPFAQPVLTPAVISKLPLGLLGFFGIKNGGQYPQQLAPYIQPTMRMEGILAANYHENVASAPLVPSVVGFNATALTVPAGELWFVSACSLFCFTGAGDSWTGSLIARSTQNGIAANWYRALSPEYIQPANLSRVLPGQEDPFWLAPGDQVGANFSAIVNASTNAQISPQLQITRFPF